MLASHVIFSAYGFWLPNDPRGSWSTWVRSYELFLAAGTGTKVITRHSVAHAEHDRVGRLRAKSSLKRSPVQLTSDQAAAVVSGFKQAVVESDYRVFAVAVMPDHVHAVIGDHATPAARIAGHWKARATQSLTERGLHPFGSLGSGSTLPSVWAHRAWKVFLNTPTDVERVIRYVRQNPVRAGLPSQRYSFAVTYVG